jgi:hypothetical protein
LNILEKTTANFLSGLSLESAEILSFVTSLSLRHYRRLARRAREPQVQE